MTNIRYGFEGLFSIFFISLCHFWFWHITWRVSFKRLWLIIENYTISRKNRLILTCKLFMSVLWTWATARDSSWLISKLFRDNVEFRLVDPLEMKKSILNGYSYVVYSHSYVYDINLQAGGPTQNYILLGKCHSLKITLKDP